MERIRYKTRDIGYGSEEGEIYAYIIGEIDFWGKQTVFVCPDSDGITWERWYLFPDEWRKVQS